MGAKGVGRKTPDESEHITWRDGVTVPCGKLVPSANKDGPLEYNEYAVYDPKQVCVWVVFISLPGGSWIGDCHFCDP
jgi:poly [ADP-ribose] polymerase